MKYKDLVKEIEELDIPSIYHHYEKKEIPPLPYLIHLRTNRDDMSADNLNYFKSHGAAIELYSLAVDPENENKIETMLERLGLFYETDEEIFIEESRMYLKRYEFYIK